MSARWGSPFRRSKGTNKQTNNQTNKQTDSLTDWWFDGEMVYLYKDLWIGLEKEGS